MSTTARDLIRNSLKLIGVVAAGENPSAQDQTDALATLNSMLDSWSTESLVIYSKTIEDFAFVAGQQTYTMGTTGNFNTTRPQKILHAAVLDQTVIPNNEIAISLINLDQWASIHQKQITSTYATKLYVNYDNPLVTLNFWPVPLFVNGLRIYSLKPLSQIASADAVMSFPPGYDLAMRYNLAILLAAEFGRGVAPEVAAIAQTAKENILRQNSTTIYSMVDPAVSIHGKAYDWRTDE